MSASRSEEDVLVFPLLKKVKTRSKYDANIDAYALKFSVNESQLDILFFPEIPDEITVRNPPPSRRDVHTRRHPDERRRGKQKRRQESLQSRANFSGAS